MQTPKTRFMSNLQTFQPHQPIPYGRQTLGEDEIQAVIAVLKSPFLTQGPAIERFEQAVAEYCGVAYAVAFSSGTAALHGAYFAAGIDSGDEVITTPLTFLATANAVLYQQGTPVFADVDPATWNLDPVVAQAKITSKTKAIAPVHFAGQPVDLQAFYDLADQHGLMVIEDACHALGAMYNDKPIGQCRDMAVFSFHPVKSITTGEGGMVVTPHRHAYEKLLQFRTHGVVRDDNAFEYLSEGPWYYEMQVLGFNYRLTDIQAALGTVQMSRLKDFIATRRQLVQRYREAFSDFDPILMQAPLAQAQSANHLFPIVINPKATSIDRLTLFKALQAANIRPQVHYMPVHMHPYYRNHLQTRPGDFPYSEAYYQHCLSLPLYPTLSFEEQDYVIQTVQQALVG